MKAILLLAGVLAAAPAARAAQVPLEAYGRLPYVEHVLISPDGKHLAAVRADGEHRYILIRTLDGRLEHEVDLGAKLRQVRWAGSDHLLMVVSTTLELPWETGPAGELFDLMDFDLTTSRGTMPLARGGDVPRYLADYPMVRIIHGSPFVFVPSWTGSDEHKAVDALYRLDLKTGASRQVDAAPPEVSETWTLDADGQPVAATQYFRASAQWKLLLKGKDGWKTRETKATPIERPSLEGLGRRPGTVLLRASDDNQQTIILEYAADAPDQAAAQLDGPVDEPIFDPVTHLLIGGSQLEGDQQVTTFFDPRDQASWDATIAAFKGSIVSLESWTDDRRKVVVLVDDPKEGPAYALVDLDKGAATWLAEQYKDVGQDGVSEVRPVAYKAADGLTVTGYLTLPKGRDPKALPLIVLVHGGPAARDEPGFDWWSQALASRGYAVLRSNFRGSDGFGWAHLSAGFGQWGRKMQTDLSDGVRDLAAKGVIDPKRVCIVGGSYGGYAALAGATLETGVYRCAAAVAGLSDLKRMLKAEAEGGYKIDPVTRYWTRFMGVSGPNDPKLAEISPIEHIDRVSIPILLIHGEDDTTVPFEQSQIMEAALKRAGKTVTLITLKHEDHHLSHGETRLQMLQALTAFLEANNPAG